MAVQLDKLVLQVVLVVVVVSSSTVVAALVLRVKDFPAVPLVVLLITQVVVEEPAKSVRLLTLGVMAAVMVGQVFSGLTLATMPVVVVVALTTTARRVRLHLELAASEAEARELLAQSLLLLEPQIPEAAVAALLETVAQERAHLLAAQA